MRRKINSKEKILVILLKKIEKGKSKNKKVRTY